jgi:hypothetical protein
MRKSGFSRHLTLLASVALAFGLIPGVAAAEDPAPEPTNPYVVVAPDGDSMWGGSGWTPGNSIDITIDDPDPGDADYSTTITVEPSEQGDDWRLELGGVFDIQPGHVVTVTDAVAGITKTHEVRNFTVDLVNTDTDIVEGTAPPGVELRVKILEPESCDTTAIADGSGFWTASFAGLLSEGGQPCDIQAGWAGSAEWPDEGDNDVTFMGWGVGGETPHLGRFSDTRGHLFEHAIEWLAAEGITQGCNPPTNTKFCPDDNVTRGEMAVFLVRALDYTDNGGGNLFTDDDGLFYENSADRLKTAKVTLGCNPPVNDRYCGESHLTRGQMAAFLVRAMGYTDNGGGNLFIDDDGHIFENAIDKLGTAGVTLGCNPPTNDRFCPDDKVTRGQMAAFLKRALG